jgi:hypothetical protein
MSHLKIHFALEDAVLLADRRTIVFVSRDMEHGDTTHVLIVT